MTKVMRGEYTTTIGKYHVRIMKIGPAKWEAAIFVDAADWYPVKRLEAGTKKSAERSARIWAQFGA